MIVDAHQHFWRIGENECAWPTPDLAPIYRTFEPADLELAAAPTGVSGSVLVQSQPSDRDTDWLIALADATPFVKAVVGWVDLAAAGAPMRIARLAQAPKLRGLRPMLQNLPQEWITRPELAPALEAMCAHKLRFDALVFTRHLAAVRALAQRYPDLSIVIDHCAKPPIAAGALDPWREQMAALARLPNIWCKLSGLLTEAAPGAGPAALTPYVDHVLDVFGPSRVMWGSDWPVVLLARGYGDWFEMAQALTGLKHGEREQVFGGAARAFYGF